MKPVDVKSNTYIKSSKEINNNLPKFKIGDTVRIRKYKNIFGKYYSPSWSEEVFVIKKVKNTVSWTCVINNLNEKKIVGTFYENKLQKSNQKEFRIEKLIKKNDDKLCVKWKGYDNLFNSWIDKKDILYITEYFPEPKSLRRKIKVGLDLSNYVTKTKLKNTAGVDTSPLLRRLI